jgi:hypothetical protein
MLAVYGGAREYRAVDPVLRRVVVGAHLAWILDGGGRRSGGQKVHHQRTSEARPERAGGGDVPRHGTLSGEHGRLACAVELFVALDAVGVAIDFGNVVPDAYQVRIAQQGQRAENLAVGLFGGRVQRSLRGDRPHGSYAFRHRNDSEQQVGAARVTHPSEHAGLDRVSGAPELTHHSGVSQHGCADTDAGDVGSNGPGELACKSGDAHGSRQPRRGELGR